MQRVDSFARLQQLARTFSRSNFEEFGRLPHVLIAATGSVACVKIPLLIKEIFAFEEDKVEIKLVATTPALHFIDQSKIDPRVEIYVDEDEWTWQKIADPVLHIELRNWADIMLIVPLDANTLAKISYGLCDNLLTCIVRAWNFSEKNQKPLIACPAMNTQMWLHPFTDKQLKILKEELKFFIVNPVAKKLACGDIGMGGLAEVPTIVNYLHTFLEEWNNVKDKNMIDNDNNNAEKSSNDDKTQINKLTSAVDRLKLQNRMTSSLSNSYLCDYDNNESDSNDKDKQSVTNSSDKLKK